jgi:hypothetical protein
MSHTPRRGKSLKHRRHDHDDVSLHLPEETGKRRCYRFYPSLPSSGVSFHVL